MKSSVAARIQAGFSLIELLLVLAVVALIALAAFVIYPSVVAGTQANAEVSNVGAIIASTKAMYGDTLIPSGDFTGTANQAHVFPSSMNGGVYTAAAPILSQWNGTVKVNGTATASHQFQIVYAGPIPAEACLKFVSGLGTNVSDVTVAGVDVYASGVYSPSLGAANCSQGVLAASNITITSL